MREYRSLTNRLGSHLPRSFFVHDPRQIIFPEPLSSGPSPRQAQELESEDVVSPFRKDQAEEDRAMVLQLIQQSKDKGQKQMNQ